MFAPEGYIRWTDLMSDLYDWSHRILLATELEQTGKDPSRAFGLGLFAPDVRQKIAFEKLGIPQDADAARAYWMEHRKALSAVTNEISFTADILICMHISDILLQFDTLLCSSTGIVMRAPDHLLLHADRLDYCHLYKPLREQNQFATYFELFDKGSFGGSDIAARFCFIDGADGMIRLKNNSATLHSLASNYHWEVSSYEAHHRHAVMPYLNYSLVWNPESFPDEIPDLLGELGRFEPHWDVSGMQDQQEAKGATKAKRGAKPTGAREEYYSRYPNGKPNDISFDAISAELAEAGKPISARQIQNYERERNK